MGKMQREKGKRFERQIAAELRAIWPDAVVRRASQAERADNPDVFVEGGPPLLGRLWLELQDAAQPTPALKLAQADGDRREWERKRPDAPGRLPVVVWHKLGSRVINVSLRLWALDEIRQARPACAGCSPTVTMDLHSFVQLLRLTATEISQEAA